MADVSRWVRQLHRWLSLAFTLAVVVNIAALATLDPEHPAAMYVGLGALLPLIPLLLTGAYLFVLPYVTGWRGAGGRLSGR